MIYRFLLSATVLALAFLPGGVQADTYPLAQGVHQWSTKDGKLMLVVGTYQDATTFRRSHAFYFKTPNGDAWNQVAIPAGDGAPQFGWNSASHGEYTLADGIVVQRSDGVYFVVVDKAMAKDATYDGKRDARATWYRLSFADDDHPDDMPYQFKPVFKRSYRKSPRTVDAILEHEAKLQPHR